MQVRAAALARGLLRAVRFIAIAFIVSAVTIVAGHGKDYYLAPAYPPLLAIGGVAIEQLVRNARVRSAYLVAAVAVALIGVPLSLPILPPATLLAYLRTMHLQKRTICRQRSADTINIFLGHARTIVLGSTQEKYARQLENGKTIAFCEGLHPSIAKLWPGLKDFI